VHIDGFSHFQFRPIKCDILKRCIYYELCMQLYCILLVVHIWLVGLVHGLPLCKTRLYAPQPGSPSQGGAGGYENGTSLLTIFGNVCWRLLSMFLTIVDHGFWCGLQTLTFWPTTTDDYQRLPTTNNTNMLTNDHRRLPTTTDDYHRLASTTDYQRRLTTDYHRFREYRWGTLKITQNIHKKFRQAGEGT
jgi:hypothetical protein